MSFGIAGRDHADQPANEIIHNADMALYHAKSEGRNRTYIYSEAGFKDLFESGEIPLEGEILSMEDRIRGVNQPFTPSLLRKDTPGFRKPYLKGHRRIYQLRNEHRLEMEAKAELKKRIIQKQSHPLDLRKSAQHGTQPLLRQC